jgi:hypothetical protein
MGKGGEIDGIPPPEINALPPGGSTSGTYYVRLRGKNITYINYHNYVRMNAPCSPRGVVFLLLRHPSEQARGGPGWHPIKGCVSD